MRLIFGHHFYPTIAHLFSCPHLQVHSYAGMNDDLLKHALLDAASKNLSDIAGGSRASVACWAACFQGCMQLLLWSVELAHDARARFLLWQQQQQQQHGQEQREQQPPQQQQEQQQRHPVQQEERYAAQHALQHNLPLAGGLNRPHSTKHELLLPQLPEVAAAVVPFTSPGKMPGAASAAAATEEKSVVSSARFSDDSAMRWSSDATRCSSDSSAAARCSGDSSFEGHGQYFGTLLRAKGEPSSLPAPTLQPAAAPASRSPAAVPAELPRPRAPTTAAPTPPQPQPPPTLPPHADAATPEAGPSLHALHTALRSVLPNPCPTLFLQKDDGAPLAVGAGVPTLPPCRPGRGGWQQLLSMVPSQPSQALRTAIRSLSRDTSLGPGSPEPAPAPCAPCPPLTIRLLSTFPSILDSQQALSTGQVGPRSVRAPRALRCQSCAAGDAMPGPDFCCYC